MKIIALLLSTMILSMAMHPCGDDMNSDPQEVTVDVFNSSGDELPGQDDDCTPFCFCQCCRTTITVPVAIKAVSFHSNIAGREDMLYTFFYDFNHPDMIWHPPTQA